MENNIDLRQNYRSLLLIWLAILASQVVFVGLIYMSMEEVFPIDLQKPLLPVSTGDFWLLVIALMLSVHSLVLSFIYRHKLIQQSVKEQKLDVVQQALIISSAFAACVSLWGLFLAYTIHYQYFFVFLVIGFIATVLQYPQMREVENAAVSRAK